MLPVNKNLKDSSCMADRDLVRYLNRVATKAANKFKLKFRGLSKFPLDHPNIKGCEGVCEFNNEIHVNLYNGLSGSYYTLEQLIDTTLHEVAHLKFKHGQHNTEFWDFFNKIAEWYLREK